MMCPACDDTGWIVWETDSGAADEHECPDCPKCSCGLDLGDCDCEDELEEEEAA